MRGWRCEWLIGAVVLLAGLPSRADDLRPSWQCLPDDTAAVVRVPGLSSFVEAVRTRTKLGGTLLRPDRLERVWEFLTEGDDDLAGDFEESLRKYGLELSDLLAAGDEELGFAIVVRRREGLPPLAMLLGWAEPGVEPSEKILEAAKRRIEEAADDSPGLERIDLSLAGRDVLSVIEPVMGLDLRDLELDRLAEEGSDDGDYAARYAKLQERVRNAKPVQTGQTHSYLAVHHGRLLFGATIQAARSAGKGPIDPQAFEPLCGGEDSREIFEAFLAAHEGDGEPALARVLSEPAIAAANLPAGVPLAELVLVPPAFFAAVEENAATADRMAQLGLDDLGGIVWRHAFVEGCWRSSLAATLPAPRHGMLSVLDQECDTCDVPSFVTSETVGFTQISLDLGAAFRTIRELLVADPAAEQLANMFMVADVQSQAWLGADVASVLTGLGSRHWVLTFPPRITAALAEARASAKSGDDAGPVTADAVALVWEIDDEAPFLKLLGRLAPLAGGDLQEEQGFRGLRLPGGAAAFVGRGHLVMAIGDGTLEKTLSAIRNPPSGVASLRDSGALRRARELVPMPPSRMFGVTDASRTGGTLGMLRELMAGLEPEDVEEAYRDLLDAGQELLPPAREMEGMFGVGGTVLRMTEDGMLFEAAWELPPP